MKGEQQKILHKGSNAKINAFITLLYLFAPIKEEKVPNTYDEIIMVD